MKQTLRLLAIALVLCTVIGLFAGCGSKALSGTYVSTGELGGSLTFAEENKVTGEIFGITLNGTYTINDDDTITFSYTGPLGIGATLTKPYAADGDTITIDGTAFVKQ